MELKRGIPVSRGIVIGEAMVVDQEEPRIARRFINAGDADGECARFEAARQQALQQIDEVKGVLRESGQEQVARIFDAHQAILNDAQLIGDVTDKIRNGRLSGPFAVARTLRQYKKLLLDLADPVFTHRVADLADIESRLIAVMLGTSVDTQAEAERRVIVIARDLTPSQTATLDSAQVLGFATDFGGRTSHTAILANARNIPAVVGLGDLTQDISGGDLVILDGTTGKVIINPDAATRKRYEVRRQAFLDREAQLIAEVTALRTATADDAPVTLLANIEFESEIEPCLKRGAAGVGLFRTEFIFVTAKGRPSEEDHFRVYQRALSMLGDRPLVIRTMDFGADKFAVELGLPHEDNPFLGMRSIRLSLTHLDLFTIQLRAICRASALGDVRCAFPMIVTVEELERCRDILEDVQHELTREGKAFNAKMPLGLVVEVPGCVLIADRLATQVQFFSLGTNDLIQYTLAVDRNNQRVADLYQPDHPAVLRLIKETIEAGRRHGIPVSLCGEMAGDPRYTELLIGLGLREFSMGPPALPQFKKRLREITVAEAERAVARILGDAGASPDASPGAPSDIAALETKPPVALDHTPAALPPDQPPPDIAPLS